MINVEDIIDHLQYIEHERNKYKILKYEFENEALYLKRAIERAGLTDHIQEIIKVLKEEDENILPF